MNENDKPVGILIVEDEGVVGLEIQSRLTEIGYNAPLVVDTGKKAIKEAGSMKPDLVLMDISLKGEMDGVEAAQSIQRQYSIPVIFLTANTDEQTFQQAKLTGPFGYIQKPFQERELYVAIEMALYKSRKEQEVELYREKLEKAHAELNAYIKIVDQNVLTSSTDIEGIITSVSEAFCRISGYSSEEMIGKNHNIVRHPDNPKELYVKMWQTIRSGLIWRGELKNIRQDGSEYWTKSIISPNLDQAGNITGYTVVQEDITDKKIIEKLSITDSLTGLFNRRHFNSVLDQEYRRLKRDRQALIFLMFDVDNFKQYNDTYGHPKGDEVLTLIGSSLRYYLQRVYDFGFRLGGEEFGIITRDMSSEEVFAFAEKYRQGIEDAQIVHEKNNTGPFLTISVGGIVVMPDCRDSVEGIIKKADDALYQAKSAGRNQVKIAFSPLQ